MYVRNYNSSQTPQHSVSSLQDSAEETSDHSDVAPDTAENVNQTSTVADNFSRQGNTGTENGILELLPRDPTQSDVSSDKETSSERLSDIQEEIFAPDVTERNFGQNGIPRQPLRRRRLRIPTTEVESPPSVTPKIEPEPTHQSNSIQNTDKDIFEMCADIGSFDSQCSCGVPLIKNAHDAVNTGISTEDLLLGALLLLLINDHTNDGILLILGFIFITGFPAF